MIIWRRGFIGGSHWAPAGPLATQWVSSAQSESLSAASPAAFPVGVDVNQQSQESYIPCYPPICSFFAADSTGWTFHGNFIALVTFHAPGRSSLTLLAVSGLLLSPETRPVRGEQSGIITFRSIPQEEEWPSQPDLKQWKLLPPSCTKHRLVMPSASFLGHAEDINT